MCKWKKSNEDGIYNPYTYISECGSKYIIPNEKSLKANGYIYCPKCGKKIGEK